MSLLLTYILRHIESGAAHAELCAVSDAKDTRLIEGSSTFVFDGGRHKLYGNVDYRIIEVSIKELLVVPGDRPSWYGWTAHQPQARDTLVRRTRIPSSGDE